MLGETLDKAWPEAQEFNRAVFDACFAGQQRVFRDAHLQLIRPGRPVDAWFDLSYWPALDARQQVRGVLCMVVETTERVIAERERERQQQRLEQAALDGDLQAALARYRELKQGAAATRN